MHRQSPEEMREVMRRWLNGEARQYAVGGDTAVWCDIVPSDVQWHDDAIYRIKPSKKRVPLTPEDFKGGAIWIRGGRLESSCMAVGLTDVYLLYCNHTGLIGDIGYATLVAENYEWSNDRVTWNPCWKEVET